MRTRASWESLCREGELHNRGGSIGALANSSRYSWHQCRSVLSLALLKESFEIAWQLLMLPVDTFRTSQQSAGATWAAVRRHGLLQWVRRSTRGLRHERISARCIHAAKNHISYLGSHLFGTLVVPAGSNKGALLLYMNVLLPGWQVRRGYGQTFVWEGLHRGDFCEGAPSMGEPINRRPLLGRAL